MTYTPPPPPTNPFFNVPYFYATNSFTLGSLSQPVNATTQITVDYSQLTGINFSDPPVFWFFVDQGGGPPLIVSNPVWNNTIPSLTFEISKGIPGVEYTLGVNIQHDTDQVRCDNLILEVIPAGNEAGTPNVSALGVGTGAGGYGGTSGSLPPTFPIPPIGNNPIMVGYDLAFINTYPRFFVGSEIPEGPNVMDMWYDPITGDIGQLVTDGSNTWWEMPVTSIPENIPNPTGPGQILVSNTFAPNAWGLVSLTDIAGMTVACGTYTATTGTSINYVTMYYSTIHGAIPAVGSRLPGELWLNLADGILGYIDATQTPQAVPYITNFSSSSTYTEGTFVFYNGQLYQANTNIISPGTFNPAQWNQIISAGGGTMTGQLILSGTPTNPLGAVPLNDVVPVTGGTFSGDIGVTPGVGDASFTLDKPISGGNSVIIGQTGGEKRWEVFLGDAALETGSNVGSDFAINRYTDSGVYIDTPVTIVRSTGIMQTAHAPVGADDVVNLGYLSGALIPIGGIVDYAGVSAPTNWLMCDGVSHPTATYPALFAIIGYGYGGAGANFNVPNLTNSVSVGAGNLYTLASTGGEATHTLVVGEMPAHAHTENPHTHTDSGHIHGVYDTGHTHTYDVTGSGGGPFGAGSLVANVSANTGNAFTGISIEIGNAAIQNATSTMQNTGGGGPHNNLQPYLALNKIIRAA